MATAGKGCDVSRLMVMRSVLGVLASSVHAIVLINRAGRIRPSKNSVKVGLKELTKKFLVLSFCNFTAADRSFTDFIFCPSRLVSEQLNLPSNIVDAVFFRC